MSCMKCGKAVSEGQLFCEACLAEMEHYPVKPGTPVLLPHRESFAPQRKRRSQKRVRKPEEQVFLLKRMVLWLCIFLCLAVLVAGLSIGLNFKLMGGDVTKLLPALFQ